MTEPIDSPPALGASGWPPPPPEALACPKCGAAATPANDTQTCATCQTRFLLRAGVLTDASVQVPAPTPGARDLSLRAPGLFVVSAAFLKPEALGYGALDPVLGHFPIDEKGVRYEHVYSVATWRALAVAQVVTFVVVSLPLGLVSLVGVLASGFHPAALLFGLPFLALSAFHGYRTFGSRATRVKVFAPKGRLLDMTFVGSLKKREQFHAELLRRCGLAPAPLP